MKGDSLRKILYNHIKEDIFGFVPLDELHDLAKKNKHKQSYAERVLRLLTERGLIRTIYNDKGYVIGFSMPKKQKSEPEIKLIPIDFRTAIKNNPQLYGNQRT